MAKDCMAIKLHGLQVAWLTWLTSCMAYKLHVLQKIINVTVTVLSNIICTLSMAMSDQGTKALNLVLSQFVTILGLRSTDNSS